MAERIPAHLEVAGLIRRVQQAGGFAAVLAKGEPDAGTILLILADKGAEIRAFERMPTPSGAREWVLVRTRSAEAPEPFDTWLERRRTQDRDLWIVELDVADGERFIG